MYIVICIIAIQTAPSDYIAVSVVELDDLVAITILIVVRFFIAILIDSIVPNFFRFGTYGFVKIVAGKTKQSTS